MLQLFMYGALPADIRANHPYHMIEEIKAQPEAVARAISLTQRGSAEVVRLLAGARRVFVTGCGTSFNAACCGAWFLRGFSRGNIDARAIESFELTTYLPGLRPDDVIVALSHSGSTPMTMQALERGRRAGCETVLITGFPDAEGSRLARHVLPTGYAEERSWAHTVSYTATLATLAMVANSLAAPEERLDLLPLTAVMTEALGLEGIAHRLAISVIEAEGRVGPADVVVSGAGPNRFTATEARLKLQETSYTRAAAAEIEEMLHGPLAAATPDTLLIVIAPGERSTDRALDLAHAAEAIGITPVVLCGEGNAERFENAHRLVLPDVPEIISPIPFVVPLQLLAYYLAAGKGINPDLLHRDDERYLAARAQYR
jgi:glucosamine 6-phosphate synthetase-like amidotransferase/phosphosugar isomerase protein